MTPVALLRRFAAVASLVVLSVLLLNALVDPYGYLGTPGIDGLTTNKPRALLHDRYFKAGLMRRKPADCLLAGSSRIGEGIPADHSAFASCREVLDVSFAGPNVAEMTGIVEAAEGRHGVSRVVLSLDFFAFNATRDPTRGGNTDTFSDGALSRLRNIVGLLGSTDVAVDSILTIAGQRTPVFYRPDGTVNQAYLAGIEAQRPTRSTFLRGVRGYIFHHLPAPEHQFVLSQGSRQPLEELRAFLLSQHARGTSVHLFFSPAHAWQWELIDALGLWSLWEQWKREVVAANESAAAQAGRPPFPLWDFASYDGPALEDVAEDRQANRPLEHYWDPSHFKQNLGSLILTRMLEPGGDGAFGELRTGSNVDEALARNRAQRDRWRAQHAADVVEIRSVVACYAPAQVLTRLSLSKGPGPVCQGLTAATR